jgi:PST family polysaccharide transporter
MVGAGLIIGVVVSLSAPLIVHVVLGKEYAPSIPVIRVLAFLIPLTGAGFALGQQCMLPLGLEKAFVRTVMVSAVVDITAAIILAPRLGALGQAIAILCAESTTIAGNYIYLMRKGLAPHQWRQRPLTSGETTAA